VARNPAANADCRVGIVGPYTSSKRYLGVNFDPIRRVTVFEHFVLFAKPSSGLNTNDDQHRHSVEA